MPTDRETEAIASPGLRDKDGFGKLSDGHQHNTNKRAKACKSRY